MRACVCLRVSAEAQPSLCAPDKSIVKVSAAQLAEMASLYRISGRVTLTQCVVHLTLLKHQQQGVTGHKVVQLGSVAVFKNMATNWQKLVLRATQTDKKIIFNFTFACLV